jgi:hypothetical protein
MGPPECVREEYGANYLGGEGKYYLEHILGR